MKNTKRKMRSGSTRWIVIGSLAALLVVTGVVFWQSRPLRMVTKKQAALVAGIEKRSPGRIERMVADHYEDRWGFDKDDAVVAIVDVGSQFFALVLTPEEQTIEIEGDRAVVTSRLVVTGKPAGPIGNEVTRRINQLGEPFVFTWEKQGFLPASWRLVNIENPELPNELYGYEPGDIRRATRGN